MEVLFFVLREKRFRCGVCSSSEFIIISFTYSTDIIVNICHQFDDILFNCIRFNENFKTIEINIRHCNKSVQWPTIKPERLKVYFEETRVISANQSMVQPEANAGNLRARSRNFRLSGEKHRTI